MKLSIVLSFVCLAFTVYGAPAQSPKTLDKSSPAKQDNGLEAELEGAGNSDDAHQVTMQDGAPEVKRSERVSTDEDDFTGLSGTMELADQDVKDVLKAFFQGLRDHPEIVADILGNEGEKILQQSADVLSTDEESRDVMDSSMYENPSPQLVKSPKQVEKKTGEFPAYPRFIYKSPMRNAAERDQMTSTANKGKPQQRSGSKSVAVDNAFKVDISNAIPVIQQPSTMQKTDESVNIVPDELEEGGVEDEDSLHEDQAEQSPFINPLPVFPQPGDQTQDSRPEPEEAQQGEQGEPDADSNMLSKKSKPEHDNEESSSESSEGDSGEESAEDSPHYLTGQEIAAEDLAHPVEQESKVPFYYYYYDDEHNNDDQGAGEQDEDAEEDESQLDQLNSQSYPEEYDGELEEYPTEEGEDSDGTDSQEDNEEDEDEEEEEDSDTESTEESSNESEENMDEIEDEDDSDESEDSKEKEKSEEEEIRPYLPQTQTQNAEANSRKSEEAALMSLAGQTPQQRGRVVGIAM